METFELTRFCFLRALAFIYCIAFAVTLNQWRALCGSRGLLPVPLFLQQVSWRSSPSLFFMYYSDRFAMSLAWLGLGLALVALSGVADTAGFTINITLWFTLWLLYLSFVNVGQTFYGFGWETLLLETGFLAIFFSPSHIAAPEAFVWLLRWLLFRLMFGAGLIKIRADRCWWDLTCLHYHYQTQPMPNPLSRTFHHLPKRFHQFCVLYTHFVELVVPWFYFAPQPLCAIAGVLTIYFQLMLIFSGNLSWLNYITLVLCIPCFNDAMLTSIIPWSTPQLEATPWPWTLIQIAFVIAICLLSIRPTINLLKPYQLMNASFDVLHLVNTYGAFGSVTKRRFEIIIEGTADDTPDNRAKWHEYHFKGKPGDIAKCPPLIAPYHLRLDWLMWFAAMGPAFQYPWFRHLIAKLLQGDKAVLKLLANNPFPNTPPRYIRAQLYEYEFTARGDASKDWWQRRCIGPYFEAHSLNDPTIILSLRSRK